MITSWKPLPLASHRSLKSIEGLQQISLGALPDTSELRSGESLHLATYDGSENLAWTGRERFTFHNGARAEDLEGGKVRLTHPDGKTHELSGDLGFDANGSPRIAYRLNGANSRTMTQTLTPQGGARFSVRSLSHRGYDNFTATPDGSLTATSIKVEKHGQGVALYGDRHNEVLVPAVPIDWLIADS